MGQNNTSAHTDSITVLLEHANQSDSIKYLITLGTTSFEEEDYATALQQYFLGLKLAEASSNIHQAAYASNNIGRVYYDMENYKEGLIYLNKSLKYYQIENDKKSQGGIFNNIALIYYETDSIDRAIEYYQKALDIKKKFNEKLNIAAIQHNLGLVFIEQKDYAHAIQNLVSSRKIFEELGHSKHVANTTNNIGRAYYKNGEYDQALEYYKKGLEEAKKINSAFLVMDNYHYQADCYGKMNNYEQAFNYSNKYHALNDSVLNIDKKKELAEIHARFENEIEEQENKLLKKENEANAATIKLQYMAAAGILIIAVFVGILALNFYFGNKAKKKTNDILRAQKLEIEQQNKSLSTLNLELSEQKKEVEALNSVKDKLFSIISHEFRSPLNSLKGTLTLMEIGALSDEEITNISKELSDKINSTSIFLENLLNWAKSQMRGFNAIPEQVELKELTEENIELLRPIAAKKNIRLENNLPDDSNAFIDPNMINLILRNLISNAIKFSLSGGVIEVNSDKNEHYQTISIKDHGIGMTKETMNMLFKMHTFTTRGTANERGTGLGLYIAKNFVETNGGEIWVESEANSGSTFSFTIPTETEKTLQNP